RLREVAVEVCPGNPGAEDGLVGRLHLAVKGGTEEHLASVNRGVLEDVTDDSRCLLGPAQEELADTIALLHREVDVPLGVAPDLLEEVLEVCRSGLTHCSVGLRSPAVPGSR